MAAGKRLLAKPPLRISNFPYVPERDVSGLGSVLRGYGHVEGGVLLVGLRGRYDS